jgi:hypothetical protein
MCGGCRKGLTSSKAAGSMAGEKCLIKSWSSSKSKAPDWSASNFENNSFAKLKSSAALMTT